MTNPTFGISNTLAALNTGFAADVNSFSDIIAKDGQQQADQTKTESPATRPGKLASIKNFGKIDDAYYRGEEPKKDEDYRALTALGIKTIIDLRDKPDRDAQTRAEAAGMKYFNIPLSDSRQARTEDIDKFLKLVNDPAEGPVFVHCIGGRHRTGEMTAIYRMTKYRWTADQAFAEMKRYDWYGHNGHGPTKDCVYDFYNRILAAERASAQHSQ